MAFELFANYVSRTTVLAATVTGPAPVLLAALGLFALGLAVTISGLWGGRDND